MKKILLTSLLALSVFFLTGCNEKQENQTPQQPMPIKKDQPMTNLQIENNENNLWETYTNTNIGFSINYPKNWIVKENDIRSGNGENTAKSISIASEDYETGGDDLYLSQKNLSLSNGFIIEITPFENPNKLNTYDFIKNDLKHNPEMYNWENYPIGKNIFIKETTEGKSVSKKDYAYYINESSNKKIYLINGDFFEKKESELTDEEKNEYTEKFNKIMESFKGI